MQLTRLYPSMLPSILPHAPSSTIQSRLNPTAPFLAFLYSCLPLLSQPIPRFRPYAGLDFDAGFLCGRD